MTARACRCVCPPKHGPDDPILEYFAELCFERLEPRGRICLVLGACVGGLLSELGDLSLQFLVVSLQSIDFPLQLLVLFFTRIGFLVCCFFDNLYRCNDLGSSLHETGQRRNRHSQCMASAGEMVSLQNSIFYFFNNLSSTLAISNECLCGGEMLRAERADTTHKQQWTICSNPHV